jgi:histone H3/H4
MFSPNVLQKNMITILRFQSFAADLLKEVSENYLVDIFERATVVTKIRNRVTLMPCDFEAVFKILRVDYPSEIIEARKKAYENSIEGNFYRNNIDILNRGFNYLNFLVEDENVEDENVEDENDQEAAYNWFNERVSRFAKYLSLFLLSSLSH